jgi:hypothetical protein
MAPGTHTTDTKGCQFCGKTFNVKGLGKYKKACKVQMELKKRDEHFLWKRVQEMEKVQCAYSSF